MKVLNLIICFIMLIVGAQQSQAGDFEGTFTLESKFHEDKNDEETRKVFIQFYVKDAKTLIELHSPNKSYDTKILIDQNSNEIYHMMDAGNRKLAMRKELTNGGNELLVNDNVSVKRTQETKDINEYQCKKYIIKANKANSQVWVTKELDFNFTRLFNALNDHPRNQEVTSKIPSMDQLSLNGFPVASVLQHKSNHDWVRTKLTEIKEKQLPQSKFDLSGYYVQDGNNNSFIQQKN